VTSTRITVTDHRFSNSLIWIVDETLSFQVIRLRRVSKPYCWLLHCWLPLPISFWPVETFWPIV